MGQNGFRKKKGENVLIMYDKKRGMLRRLLSTVLTVALLTGSMSISAYAVEPAAEGSAAEETAIDESEVHESDGSYEDTSVTEDVSAKEDASVIENIQESIEDLSGEGEEEILSEETSEDFEEEAVSDEAEGPVTEDKPVSADNTEPDPDDEIVFPEGFEGRVDDEAAVIKGEDIESADGSSDIVMLGADTDVLVDITGKYYTLPADTILKKLNQIRKEAYELGYVDEYVPVKWSSNIEAAARIRAMEAGISMGHTTLGSQSIYSYTDSKSFWTKAENLAWNNDRNNEGILRAINQFYSEKSNYAANRKDGGHRLDGHYVSMINPEMTHVGVGSCQLSCTPNGWVTVAMQLGGSPFELDDTKDSTTGTVTQTLKVSPGKIGSLTVSGPPILTDGDEASYELGGKLKVKTSDGNICPAFVIPGSEDRGVIWTSSDTNVVTVENGTVRAVGGGDAVVTARIGTLKAECRIAVAKPTTGFTIRNAADDEDITSKVIEGSVGQTIECRCIVEPEDAYDKTIKWSSSDTSIASAKSTGESSATVRITGCGEAVITCINENASEPVVRTFTVMGSINAAAVSLNRSEIILYAGESTKLVAAILPEGTEGRISYESDQTEVATVSSDGVVTAVSEGEAKITASSGSLLSAVCVVKVIGTNEAVGDISGKVENLNGVWVASDSIESSFTYCGRAITQPQIRVYCGNHSLKEGTDYTLSYKNNIKAADADAKNAPQVTVNLKGHYQGKKTYKFSIEPLDIADDEVIEKTQLVASSTGKDVKPAPVLWYGDKKLVNKKDFTCEYTDTEYRSTDGEHEIKVKGCGNFNGERIVRFRIVDPGHNLAKASVTVSPAETGTKKIMFKGELRPEDIKLTVRFGRDTVPESYYTITSLPQKPGKGNITVEATAEGNANSYYGSKTVKVTTYADRSIKDVTVSDFDSTKEFDYASIKYMGGMIQSATLTYNGETLRYGEDYSVSYSSHKKVGTANVTYKGLGRYSGKLVKSYKITPYSGSLNVTFDDFVTYVKGGVRPAVTVTDKNNTILKEKVDYTISIKNKSNQKPGTMTFRIVGKGNIKGCVSDYYEVSVGKGNLTTASLKLSDKKYVTKGSGWKSSVKVLDSNGKTLVSGKDYDKKVLYSYAGMADGKVPAAGTTVYVTVVGKGYYEGSSITRSYRIIEKNISSLVFVTDDMTYTGSSIEPVRGIDIHAYASKKDAKAGRNELKTEYEVVGFSSNSSSGTGRITVKGVGSYGGSRELKFKIRKQRF